MKTKLKWYQIFFNERFHYRKDYTGSFWYYINQYVKKVIDFRIYTDRISKPTIENIEIKGLRGGKTGTYTTKLVRKRKPTHESLTISFLRWTWFGISIEFHYSTYVYFKCGIGLTFHKPKITFNFDYSNI
jgi:hypothetical protein